MILIPEPWWLTAVLAVVLLADALLSLRPPGFVRDCLNGVHFPREWWWTLIVIKLLGAAGLLVGIGTPGVAFAANVGVVVYFVAAAYAHIRARFLRQEFWLNCLGMLALSLVVLLVSYLR
ncbi:DoxX family protein [Leifsonia poae]|uniref:DoxX family protein n=1 Tax=Leifsonia poae TaxID=110933 RepID=UPI001CBBF320|nr:DoxX family protein [Leifsonia poae]